MIEFHQSIKTFTTLICIERKLQHNTPQFQKDAFNAVVNVENEKVHIINWQSFVSLQEIPIEVVFIRFWDSDQAFPKDAFANLWTGYLDYFSKIFQKESLHVPERTGP